MPKPHPHAEPEAAAITHISDAAVGMMRATMAASVLPDRWEALLGSLSDACRKVFGAQPLPPWVSTAMIAEVVERYNALTGSDTANVRAILLMDRLIGAGRPDLVAARNPWAALEAVKELFPRHHRGGVLDLEPAGSGALVRLWATIPYPHYLTMFVPAALTRAVEICGAERVRTEHRPPDPAECPYLHRYQLSWTVRT